MESGEFFPWIQTVEREVNRCSPTSIYEVKSEWSFSSTPHTFLLRGH
jgi:hypothetical protein